MIIMNMNLFRKSGFDNTIVPLASARELMLIQLRKDFYSSEGLGKFFCKSYSSKLFLNYTRYLMVASINYQHFCKNI